MNSNNPVQHRIVLLILIISGISLVTLFIIGFSSQGRLTGSAIKDPVAQGSSIAQLTYQSSATLTNCTVIVLAPEYSPKHFYPPSIVIYDSRPFLVNWTVINTSEDCVWSTLQLLTVVDGQLKTLNMMPSYRSLPAINEEYAIWDKNNLPVNQVKPKQRVTISIQISGLDLISSNGKIDRSFNMIVNGQLAAGGILIAQQSQWVVLILPSETPTITFTPTETPTITGSPTGTPNITVSPTRTPNFFVLPTMTPTIVVLPPRRIPTRTPTIVVLPTLTPTKIPPSATPTLALPPIDTPTFQNP